jgi:hypothetical protein
MMTERAGDCVKDGWLFAPITFDEGGAAGLDDWRLALQAAAIEAAEARSEPAIRRSRHASTYLVQLDRDGQRLDFFVKVYRPPAGVELVKRPLRGSRMKQALKISAELRKNGFQVPAIMISGANSRDGRSMLITARAKGMPLPEAIMTMQMNRKRALLKALGGEVARLHRRGFIHGDLTPHNIFVSGEAARFTFIDNDRTRRAIAIGAARRRLRNFVQLGRFNLDGVTRADLMRVLRAYALALGIRNWRATRDRAAAMLHQRIDRDRARRVNCMEAKRRQTPRQRRPRSSQS